MRIEAAGGILARRRHGHRTVVGELAVVGRLPVAVGDTDPARDRILAVRRGSPARRERRLMAVFFFVVGLEIKRELVAGELRDRRAVALPAFAALGGMVVPALIFVVFNAGGPAPTGGASRWPPTSPSPFGVLAVLGHRVPPAAQGLPADAGHRRRPRRHRRDRHLLQRRPPTEVPARRRGRPVWWRVMRRLHVTYPPVYVVAGMACGSSSSRRASTPRSPASSWACSHRPAVAGRAHRRAVVDALENRADCPAEDVRATAPPRSTTRYRSATG